MNVLVRLGNILREQGDAERALEFHLRAAEIAPENLDVLYGLADDYSVRVSPKKEIEVLEKILGLDQKSPRILCRMREIYKNGSRHLNNDNFDLAITEFKRALRENGRCLPAHLLLGDAYLKTGDKRGALRAWKKGYANTKSTTCMMRMEKVYRDLDQAEEMIKEYKEAIMNSQNETRETLIILLSVLCLEERTPQETIRVIEENTGPEKGIIPSLILSDAYKQDHNETKSQKALEVATRQIKRAVSNFKCGACGNISGEWTDNCSACNVFGAIECFPGVNS